ncbi:MDR family MFS transporter [Lentilactobacillus diolivorans]|uniref:Drug resistance MFS transporter, drug H+ antiporter-2 family n=2 Tax=Lentilactobacillus diolivorans TaxID=179838 RepID=A0A0R1S905_9LACO|nr:MDR family MFS transporter [Lentilactobacillus diolivorans]KRL65393.1 drug resistance MFS transporter, drug H+ antiporter-2 family [Lentilactobacillus diolivorans DSM 14421]GEP23221.1 MFS transporter [Lentilactobacillus diolivorans]
MAKAQDINGKAYNRGMMIVILLIGTFCTVLNQTILSTAFPTIMKAFDVSTSTVQWLTTGFMMVNGIMIPISAWLSTRFNTKMLYISAMSIFLAGTVVSYIAPTFGVLLAGRLIQAVGVGVTMPLLQTIMLSIFPPAKRGTAMGLAGIVIGLAPAIGPTLSGWVIDNWTWRDLFGMIVPLMILVIAASFWFVKPVLPTKKEAIDVLSVVLSTVGFGSALYGFSSVGDDGWGSATVISTLIIGAVFIALFIWRQLTMKEPFLEFRVYRSTPFTISAILSSVTMMAMVGVEMVIPLYLQIVKGMSAFESGLTLLAGAVMMGIMSPITGRAVDQYGAKRLSIIGMFLLTLGSIPFIFITKDTSTIYIVFFYAVRMFGISMAMMPATTVGMNSLPVNLLSHGTAVNNTQRQIASSVGTAILISILTNVTNNNMPGKHLLKSNPLGYQTSAINATLTGYHAAFLISFIFCLLALVTAFFLKNRAQSRDYTKGHGEK